MTLKAALVLSAQNSSAPGGERLLLVLGMHLQELFVEWEQHWAPSCLSWCVSISELLNPLRSPHSGTRTQGTESQSSLCLLVKTKCSTDQTSGLISTDVSKLWRWQRLGERQGLGVGRKHQGGVSWLPQGSSQANAEAFCQEEKWAVSSGVSPTTANILRPLLFSRWWKWLKVQYPFHFWFIPTLAQPHLLV